MELLRLLLVVFLYFSVSVKQGRCSNDTTPPPTLSPSSSKASQGYYIPSITEMGSTRQSYEKGSSFNGGSGFSYQSYPTPEGSDNIKSYSFLTPQARFFTSQRGDKSMYTGDSGGLQSIYNRDYSSARFSYSGMSNKSPSLYSGAVGRLPSGYGGTATGRASGGYWAGNDDNNYNPRFSKGYQDPLRYRFASYSNYQPSSLSNIQSYGSYRTSYGNKGPAPAYGYPANPQVYRDSRVYEGVSSKGVHQYSYPPSRIRTGVYVIPTPSKLYHDGVKN